MKINAIRIKNLASLEGITEIDFTSEPLASAGIFAITGSTGSGKSTLLDALCLALYGETPRYLQAKEREIKIHDVQGSTMSQDDVRGILRDGTSEGFAEVDFIGIDGHNYRSTWSVRRARNKAEGSIQASTISLKNVSTNTDLPGKKAETYNEIERLVGLNFEQFTRSVLLAQGDFTAFMKANKDEKSSLLEKLTGTHIYSEISKKVFENYRNQEQILRDLKFRKEGISTLSEEELNEFQEQELFLTTQINQFSKEIEVLSKEISWHEQLVFIQKNKDEAVINLQKADELLIQNESRKNKLIEIEQAQTTRTWNDALLYNQKQLSENNATLELLKEKISTLELQKKKFEEDFKKNELNFSQAIEIQKKALPKLVEARKLDTLVSENSKQTEQSKSEVEIAQTKLENHQKECVEKETEIIRFSSEMNAIEEWLIKYASKKAIAEHKDLIVSKLIDAEKLVAVGKTATEEKKVLVEKIAITISQIENYAVDFQKLESDYLVRQKAFDKESNTLLLIPIEELQLEKDATDSLLNSTLEAQSIWNVLQNLKTDFEVLVNKNEKDLYTIKQKKEYLQHLKMQLERDEIAKESSEKMLQKARLSATETVETLRETLVDNEPCPVCGSENHPFALHNPQLQKVLTTLEELHLQNEKTYLKIFGENRSLEQEVKGLTELIEQQELEISTKKSFIEIKNKEWNLISIDFQNNNAVEKSNELEKNVKNLKEKQAALQLQIKTHLEQKNLLEKQKVVLNKLKEDKDLCNANLKTSENQLAIYNQQMESFNKELLQINSGLTAIKTDLSSYFTALDWMEKWTEKPDDFVSSIVSFAQDWKLKLEKLELVKNQHALSVSTLNQLRNQEKTLVEELLQKTNFWKVQKETLEELETKRNALFDGISVELMEQKFAKSVEETQKNLEETKQYLQQNKVDLVVNLTSVKDISAGILKFTSEIENAKTKIQNWLNDYNLQFKQTLSILELNELLTFTSEWINNERNVLNNLELEKTKASSILLERTKILDEHSSKKYSERSFEDLKILFENSKIQNENSKQVKANIGFKLQENEINKAKIGGLLKEIDTQFKVYENWSKLNDIIGSADGKKFRQIAQEHTLEVLLSFANIHLQVLTNRYKIERIPNTLGLQVVDLDMGDEIRTVFSLSGGESFLVSLALALGLASLSSNKMKVESLFIDEGFGSLDPNTLNIAMDALEGLHHQGRKVGVISHVQEMTERIPVQIKVSKKANGRSKVEIVGFG